MTVEEAARGWKAARRAEREARETLSKAIREARAEGMSLAKIGTVVGLSRQRVEQLSK